MAAMEPEYNGSAPEFHVHVDNDKNSAAAPGPPIAVYIDDTHGCFVPRRFPKCQNLFAEV